MTSFLINTGQVMDEFIRRFTKKNYKKIINKTKKMKIIIIMK